MRADADGSYLTKKCQAPNALLQKVPGTFCATRKPQRGWLLGTVCLTFAFSAFGAAASDAECATESGRDVLAEVRARDELRIGTTGDYTPFSYLDGEERRGIDIDLGRSLANALDVDVRWVPTTWATLAADLAAGAFDIAMSGISVTAARRQTGCFSRTYFTTGKTVIARCERAAEFDRLQAIDRAGVRVIVNPGGTNEAFARRALSHADLVVHPDNTTIFSALASGAADLMITDAVEVDRMVQAYPELCAPIPDTFFEEALKAFYLPKDAAWWSFVSGWLERVRTDGELAEVTARYVAPPRERDLR